MKSSITTLMTATHPRTMLHVKLLHNPSSASGRFIVRIDGAHPLYFASIEAALDTYLWISDGDHVEAF